MAAKAFSSLDRHVWQDLLVLFTAGLLFWTALASLLPVIPLYVRHTGASRQEVGWVMGAFAIGLLACRGWLGLLSDRHGRKPILMLGLAVVAIAPWGYLAFPAVPSLIGVRAFHGLSIAAFTTTYMALVVDRAPPTQRGELIGYMSLVNPVGMALGPAMGGGVQKSWGYGHTFAISAGLGFLGFLCTLYLQANSQANLTPNPPLRFQKPAWKLLLEQRWRVPTLILLLIGGLFGCISTFLPLFIQQVSPNFNPGLFYTAAAISSFVIRLPVGRASDRYGRGLFISLSLIFYLASMVILALAKQPAHFLLAGVVEGCGGGVLLPMILALVADRSDALQRGRMLGLCMGGFDLGMALAGPLLGSVADIYSYPTIFGFAGGLAGLALALFLANSNKDFSHSWRYGLGLSTDAYALPVAMSPSLPMVAPAKSEL